MSGEKTLDRVNLQIFPQCEHEIGGKEEEECGPQPIVYFKHREKHTVIIGSLTHGKVVMWSTMPNVRGTCRFLVVCKRKIGDKEEENACNNQQGDWVFQELQQMKRLSVFSNGTVGIAGTQPFIGAR